MNLINLLFLQLTLVIVLLGSLMNLVEHYLPVYIKQIFRYGKHSYEGDDTAKLIKKLEIPKEYFRHFYIFAIIWSWAGLLLYIYTYFFNYTPNMFLIKYLDISCGSNRETETSAIQTFVALLLVVMQCTRRFVETNFLQIFSKSSKINLTHYICGYLHYYGLIVLILGKSDGFIRNQTIGYRTEYQFSDLLAAIIAAKVFVYLWFKQFETNMIFIKLRKTESGKIATEKHLLPQGGWFTFVSSPHMTTEVGMYLTLYILLHNNTSYKYCLMWVLSNQICNALLTHKWYLKTFKNYPKQRKAIIPFIL